MKPFRAVGQGQEGVPSLVMTKECLPASLGARFVQPGWAGVSPISLLSARQDITNSLESILPNGRLLFLFLSD